MSTTEQKDMAEVAKRILEASGRAPAALWTHQEQGKESESNAALIVLLRNEGPELARAYLELEGAAERVAALEEIGALMEARKKRPDPTRRVAFVHLRMALGDSAEQARKRLDSPLWQPAPDIDAKDLV